MIASVILPTYNRARYLRPAVESVLSQTLADWELIIADDGSTEEEARAYLRSLADPRVRILWLEHSGNPARVRNAAIRAARGDYLAFLDSDDGWAPAKLERQIAALRASPGRRWSYTGCDRIDERGAAAAGAPRGPAPEGWILETLLFELGKPVVMAAVVAERALVDEIGGFDERQLFCEDLDLYLRLAMRSPVCAVQERLCSIRAHAAHYSGDRIGEYENRVRLYGKMADLLTDPRLSLACVRIRARQALIVAGLQGDKGESRALFRTLGRASRFAWRYPEWWLGAAKTVARLSMPARVLSAYRRFNRE
jgi:glycosyltransferase involved in cell wall biosynthesis